MGRKRDKNGRFAKKELTSKEYEAIIAELEKKIKPISFRVDFWQNKYFAEKERFELAEVLCKKRGEAIKWLLSKLPFWTRNKFWKKFGVL